MADGSANVKATNKAEWGRTASQYSAMTLAPGETKGIGRPLYGAYVNALSNGSQKSLRILDVSSGAGEPALSLAQALPDSTVQLTDIAPEMLAEASRRAQDMGIKNTRFAPADAEDLSGYADGSFDVVTCNCGLMFMPHYERALSEFHRVLVPGGRVLLSVWAKREKTNLISLMHATKERIAPKEDFFADPNVLGDEAKLLAAVRQAGFKDCQCKEVNVEMRIEVARLRPAVLDNAVASELLNRLQAQGERDIYDRALQAMLDAAAKAGYIQEGSTVINAPENVALFVTAYA